MFHFWSTQLTKANNRVFNYLEMVRGRLVIDLHRYGFWGLPDVKLRLARGTRPGARRTEEAQAAKPPGSWSTSASEAYLVVHPFHCKILVWLQKWYGGLGFLFG
jgi:hypothetical protein